MTVWCQSTHKTEIVSVGSAAESAEIPFFLRLNAGGCGGVGVCLCFFCACVCMKCWVQDLVATVGVVKSTQS